MGSKGIGMTENKWKEIVDLNTKLHTKDLRNKEIKKVASQESLKSILDSQVQ